MTCSTVLLVLYLEPLRSVQFSSVQSRIYGFDISVTATLVVRGHLAWTLLGIFYFPSIILCKVQSHYVQFSSAKFSAPSQTSTMPYRNIEHSVALLATL